MTLVMDILDYGLLLANLYVLIRIRLSREESFKTPFFYWFFWTGMVSSLSVIGFIIAVRFTYAAENGWGFKFGYMLNSFSITFATLGKTYISIHRYSVMRTSNFREDIWSRKMSYILTAITCVLSLGACSPVIWCRLTYKIVNNVNVTVYLDDTCTITQKSRASAVYLLDVLINIVLTALTSRQFMIRIMNNSDNSLKRVLISSQRNMFIIVIVGTVTQCLKATHQCGWVFVAAFGLKDFNVILQNTYDFIHYTATYSFTASLLIFNKKVRKLMISTYLRNPASNYSSNQAFSTVLVTVHH